ncbi:MAG: Usg family protein [Alphaproteobacteria bacterium]|nr:Usg family protein [Alphaproteobacteria bacterium]
MQEPHKSDLSLMLSDWRLTTAEILYHMPDHPLILQSYTWQELDLIPDFPQLKRFLTFWERELEGRLHSVTVASCDIIKPASLVYSQGEIKIH